MGLIRGGTVFFIGVLLFLSFLAMNSFLILGSSLKYDNVRDGLYPLIQEISETTGQQIIPKDILGEFNLTKAAEDVFNNAKVYCRNQNNTEYVSSYKGYSINFSCQDVLNSSSSRAFINETFDDVIYDIYYKEYDCNFWNCLSKTGLPFFLVSEKAHDYWQSKFYFAILASLVLIVLIFLFTENRMNTPILAGILLILSALPLLKLGDLLYGIAGKFSVFLDIFLSSTRGVFWFSFVLGMLLVGSGIALRIWNPGGIKEKLSRKEVKEIVREEIKQVKQAKRKK